MQDPLHINFSTTKTVKHTHTNAPISLYEYLLHVKRGTEFCGCDLKKQINKVRSQTNKEQRSLEKLKLPSVRVGIYQPKDLRKIKTGTITSLISFDIDHLGSIETINRTKVILSEALYKPVTMFVSPSGDGLKLVYWTNLTRVDSKTGESDFKRAWDLIASYINKALEENGLDVKVDQAPKNPASSMFACYDPQLWINSDPNQCKIKIEDLDGYSNEIECKKTDTQTKAIEKQVKYKTQAQASIKPSLNQFESLLANLASKRKEKAFKAIEGYLNTPSGLGKRYNAFFKAVSCIAHLGLSKDKLIEIMHLLDYDQSRDKSAVLQSLNKYGFFNGIATNQPSYQQEHSYQEHLNSLTQANQTIPIHQWVSEASDQIVKSIQDNHVTMLMSPTGSGKTSFCLKDLPKSYTQGRIFFAVPLISLREQVSAYLDHKTSQILRDGETLKPYKRLIILSYEKLASILPQLGKQDLLIIDEIHLFSSTFRSNATSKILTQIKEQATKTLLLSASGHEISCILSKVFETSFNSIQLESQQKKPFNLKVVKTASILDSVVSSCIDKLNNNPKAKILVYKDDIEDLHEIESKLKDKAVSSIVLTSSHKDTETFKSIFNGSTIPLESVILATGVVSVGVALPFIDHIIVAGKVSTASLIQVADRGRRGQDVEMLISTNQRKVSRELIACFKSNFLQSYLEKVQRFVNFENERIDLLWGTDLSTWEIDEYIKATHHTLKTSSVKHTNTPLHGILACSRSVGTLIMSIQGVLSNIVSMEAKNESSWDYYFSKLKTLYGIEAQISESTEAKKDDKKEKGSVWDILKERINKDEEIGIDKIEESLKEIQISERQKNDILEEIQRRLSFLSVNELSSCYVLLDAKEWSHFTYMASIKTNPMLHPLELALADKVKDQPKKPLFI